MIAVTRVTGRAVSADDLSEGEYREIYDELRERCSLRKFAEFIGSAVSFAWWGQYEAGEKALNHDRRNELRRIVGLPALPPTVTQALASVDEDAVVWAVGWNNQEPVYDRVLMVAAGSHEPMLLRLNGDLRVVEELATEPVTGVTRRRRLDRKHISIGEQTWERLNSARLEAGLGWEPFLGQLLDGRCAE